MHFLNTAEVVSLKSKLEVVTEDPKDTMVIEKARERHASLIVTGDSHLLGLENYKGIKILAVEKVLKSI